MSKLKLPQQNQGFTLVEVLIAILISTLFVAIAMQAIVIASVFKARARQYAEATVWIQEDLENVKSKATIAQLPLPSTTLSADAALQAPSINVASINGFANNDKLKVGSDPGTYTISNISGTALTITPKLETPQLNGAVVLNTTKCKAADPDLGFAKYLKDNLPSVINGGTKPILNETYTLTRAGTGNSTEPTVKEVAPYQVLELRYEVKKQGSNVPVPTAKIYTEVIPDAVFQCPN